MSETQKPNFQDIEDIVTEHQGALYGPAGEPVTQQQAKLIQSNKELIRAEAPTELIAAADAPTSKMNIPPPVESLAVEALRSPLSEIPPKIHKIIKIQQRVEAYKEEDDNYQITFEEAKHFTDLLLSKIVQENVDRIPLSESGLDLIIHGIGQKGAPKADELVGLQAIVNAQNIEPTGKKTYKSKFDLTFGPYDDDEEDKIQIINDKLKPENWYLTDEDREFYESVVSLESLVEEPKDYVPLPHRRMADQKLVRTFKERKNRKKFKVERAGKDDPSAEDILLSKKIHAHWQGKRMEDMVTHIILKPEDKEKILELVKAEAQEKIQRDDELRALVV